MTVRAGVVGHPIGHSLSPAIHRAWLYAAGIDGSYEPILSPLDEFAETLADLRGHGVVGVNVTIPFKEQALALADRASARARLAGAANLLRFESGEVFADNTDGAGLLQALAEQAPAFAPAEATVTLLGAGGAARGAAAALVMAGAPEVRLVNRTLARAEVVAGAVGGSTKAYPLDDAAQAFADANLVVNATSIGLASDDALSLPLEGIPGRAVVMDMTYTPLITPFLARAKLLGHPVVDGLEMLIRQAGPSFEAFFGRVPPQSVDVRALCVKALEARAAA